MTPDSPPPSPAGDGVGLLESVDPDLNIFALANSMDLLLDQGGAPNRVLVWFRDGLERRIHLHPTDADALDLHLAAEGRRSEKAGRRETTFETGISPADLRSVLVRAVDAANALTLDADGR